MIANIKMNLFYINFVLVCLKVVVATTYKLVNSVVTLNHLSTLTDQFLKRHIVMRGPFNYEYCPLSSPTNVFVYISFAIKITNSAFC